MTDQALDIQQPTLDNKQSFNTKTKHFFISSNKRVHGYQISCQLSSIGHVHLY